MSVAAYMNMDYKFEEQWPHMRTIVLKLLHQESVSHVEWQDLFYSVHMVCLWDDKGSSKIKETLKESISDYIFRAQKRVLSHEDDQTLLKAYILEWSKFFTQCTYLPIPFRHLEIGTIQTQGKNVNLNNTVRQLMLETWNGSIFSDIKYRLQDCAMKLLQAERNGKVFDSQLVIGVRESYVNLCYSEEDPLCIYRNNFETAYIESTEEFYKTQAAEYLRLHGVIEYMRYAEEKLKEEELRAQKYLERRGNSVENLVRSCVNVLVNNFKSAIIAECPEMIRNNDTENLHLMYKLLDRIPDGVDSMIDYLEEYIVTVGLRDMMAVANIIVQDCEKYVEQLLSLFQKFSLLAKSAFHNDPRFLTARDKAYKTLVNDVSVFKVDLPAKQSVNSKIVPESRCPELLANYSDMLLRKTSLSKRLTSDEIEVKLQEVLLVLKYVQNKDVFMRYHSAHLTRRLILDISADSEKEENMVDWLREVGMPADYVSKLARMFQDIKVSEDLNQQFKERYRLTKGNAADIISIKILNTGAWSSRTSERITVSLPMELEDFIPEVEDFYKLKHGGRKLQWYHHMSNGLITFTNDVGKFDFEVTTFQLAVLFSWNERPRDKISYENLLLATELSDPELRRTLWSLVAFPKLKKQVVRYSPEVQSPREFTENTMFWIDDEFCLVKNGKLQKRGRLNLIGRLQLQTEKSTDEDNESIAQLRILRVQEAIIKIMKVRKQISNSRLQSELIEILKNMFLPSKKMIKEQVEWLIEHKYMTRDEDDLNVFIYVA